MGFQYQKLIVYRRAMEYDRLAAKLIPEVRKRDPNLADHLQRSGNSMITNIAEGASEDRPLVKAAFFRTSKREAEECALSWEKALNHRYTTRQETDPLIALLDECARMLFGLIRRHDPDRAPKSANDAANSHRSDKDTTKGSETDEYTTRTVGRYSPSPSPSPSPSKRGRVGASIHATTPQPLSEPTFYT